MMETISSMAHTAAKAVWGDGTENQEPVSGQAGDVSKGEPYDAGNIDSSEKETPSGNNPSETKKEDKTSDPSNKDSEGPTAKEVDVSGPGPRPLDQVAKENGGDAGNAGKAEYSGNKTESGQDGTKDGKDQAAGSSEGQGTGEHVVPTTGLHADGGDFDATKPGAGREAERLMHEKGMTHPTEQSPKTPDTSPRKSGDTDSKSSGSKSSGSKNSGSKRGLRDKIKDKLHLNKSSD